MGINFNRVGDDYVAYLKNGKPAFEEEQPERQETVPVDKKPAGATDPINKKGLTVEANVDNDDLVADFNKKAELMSKQNKKIMQNLGIDDPNDPLAQSKKALKKAGVEAKGLEYTGTYKDFIQPKTYEETLHSYRQMKYNGQIKLKDKKTGELRDLTDAELEEMAKIKVQNDERLKKIQNTHVFIDKAEYEQKEGEKSAYIQELTEKGVSKEEAQKKADAKYGVNNYLHGGLLGSKARRFIEKHSDLFYENGKFSEDKLKDFVFKAANCLNGDDDAESAYMSLNERRAFRQMCKEKGINISVDTIGKLAKAVGMEKEFNPTFWLRAGVVAVTAGTGAAIGAATGASVAFGTFNACGQLCNGVIVPGAVVGAVTGAAAGTAATPLVAVKGRKDDHIPAIRPEIQEYVPEPEKPVEEPPVQPEPCFEDAYCDSTDAIKRGDNWSKRILAGKGVTINGTKLGYDSKESRALLNAYIHAEKLQYGITDMTLNTFISQYRKDENGNKVANHFRYYTNFDNLLNNEEIMKKHPELELLRNAVIVPDCDATTKACKPGNPKKPYHSAGIPTDHKIPCE